MPTNGKTAPLQVRTYRFGREFRRQYPAAKAFLAKQGRKS